MMRRRVSLWWVCMISILLGVFVMRYSYATLFTCNACMRVYWRPGIVAGLLFTIAGDVLTVTGLRWCCAPRSIHACRHRHFVVRVLRVKIWGRLVPTVQCEVRCRVIECDEQQRTEHEWISSLTFYSGGEGWLWWKHQLMSRQVAIAPRWDRLI